MAEYNFRPKLRPNRQTCQLGCAFQSSLAVRQQLLSPFNKRFQRLSNSRSGNDRISSKTRRLYRSTISANSLEESKKKARSQYDNIPDVNQQYIAELSWVERKYGPGRTNKDLVKEAQGSILRPPGPTASRTAKTINNAPYTPRGAPDMSEYASTRNELLGNTIFVGALGVCTVWGFSELKSVSSFGVGLLGSLAYVVLLSRSIDRLADGARESGMQQGDALQPARIALLALMVIASAKNSDKLSVLPVIMGFFTYKIAALLPLLTGEAFD